MGMYRIELKKGQQNLQITAHQAYKGNPIREGLFRDRIRDLCRLRSVKSIGRRHKSNMKPRMENYSYLLQDTTKMTSVLQTIKTIIGLRQISL